MFDDEVAPVFDDEVEPVFGDEVEPMFDDDPVLDDVEFLEDDDVVPDDPLPDIELPAAELEDGGCPMLPLCPLDIVPDGGVPLPPDVDGAPDVWPRAGNANPMASKAAASEVLLNFLSIM